MLSEDGRGALGKISEEIGLSASSIRRRVRNLEEEGIIQRYSAKVDPNEAGYGFAAFLNIDVKSGETGRVAGILTRCKGVCEVHKTTGNHGLIAKVRAEDRGSISEFAEDKVSTYQGVREVNITMTSETYKEEFLDI